MCSILVCVISAFHKFEERIIKLAGLANHGLGDSGDKSPSTA